MNKIIPDVHICISLHLKVYRPSPVVPEKVHYYTLAEVVGAAKKLGGSWSILKSTADMLILGFYNDSLGSLEKKVTINSKLYATATFGGKINNIIKARSF